MGCTPEPTGEPEEASTDADRRKPTIGSPAESDAGRDVPPKRRHELRALTRTARHGLVYRLASGTGGAVVTSLIWWHQR